MIFRGNPGTGKASVANIMGKLLFRIGVLPNPVTRYVRYSDLVEAIPGRSRLKAQAIVQDARGAVLFVDGAHRLAYDDFGREALQELMIGMGYPAGEAPVVVFAGPPANMDQLLQFTEGLGQFIGHVLDFQDYSPMELAQILSM